MADPPSFPAAGNGHVGVLDAGDPTGALLSARLRRRGHEVTRWLLGVETDDPFADRGVADHTLAWPALAPRPPLAVVPVGNRRTWRAALGTPGAPPAFGARAARTLDDEIGLLVWLGDQDADVPRVLAQAAFPDGLADALPTDGPVVVAHRCGDARWTARRCGDRADLDAALAAAAMSISASGDDAGDRAEDEATEATWFLLEDVAGDDAAVAGVFVDGEPRVWGAWQLTRDDRGRPIELRSHTGGRLFELAEEVAGLLELSGPCELRTRLAGTEAYVVGITPCVTWPLLALGNAADEAISAGLAQLGVPCADRPPSLLAPTTPRRPAPVPPQRAASMPAGPRRTLRIWTDPFSRALDVPGDFRRWAWRAGRRASKATPASKR